VRILQKKRQRVYLVTNSDAEEFVARRFPHKKTKPVSNGLAGQGTIRSFLRCLNFVFQKGQSKGLNAVYHFTFTGHDEVKATVTIRDEKLQVSEGHKGQADLRLTADSETWLRFLRKEANLIWALVRRAFKDRPSCCLHSGAAFHRDRYQMFLARSASRLDHFMSSRLSGADPFEKEVDNRQFATKPSRS